MLYDKYKCLGIFQNLTKVALFNLLIILLFFKLKYFEHTRRLLLQTISIRITLII